MHSYRAIDDMRSCQESQMITPLVGLGHVKQVLFPLFPPSNYMVPEHVRVRPHEFNDEAPELSWVKGQGA